MTDPAFSIVQAEIVKVIEEIKDMLIEKNRKYGNAAIDPVRIFSRSSAKEQILVRIDDKLNRMMNRQDDEDEDINRDLIGYLILSIVHDRISHNPQTVNIPETPRKSPSNYGVHI